MAQPHVVIVGAGFGGLAAARGLAKAPVRVTVVDKRNHHLFQPLLYQVATAGLAATDIAAPTRSVLAHQENCTVLLARATSVDPAAQQLHLTDGVLKYDHLIIAAGMTNSYFGNEAWETFAPGLKSLEDALEIRRRVLLAYEAAERETDATLRAAWLTFVVVGGGPTGVELAGALKEIAVDSLAADFRNFRPEAARVILIEGGPRLLSTFDPSLSERAKKDLTEMGVDVRLNTRVGGIDADGVSLTSGEKIAARTAVWGAGVKGVPLAATLGVTVDRAGRLPVDETLAVAGYPGVWAIGDVAAFSTGASTLPGVAPVALQQGLAVAANICARLNGQSPKPFRYVDRGSMATIGRKRAVLEAGRVRLGGFLAWLAWVFVHLMVLVDFRSRVAVFLEWVWSYLTWRRSARLILSAPIPRTRDDGSAVAAPISTHV